MHPHMHMHMRVISLLAARYCRQVITSVVESLLRDPARKFIYAEVAFFQRWWDEQDDKMQTLVKGLVASGQLEFINGALAHARARARTRARALVLAPASTLRTAFALTLSFPPSPSRRLVHAR